jgi:hypothetical protein
MKEFHVKGEHQQSEAENYDNSPLKIKTYEGNE